MKQRYRPLLIIAAIITLTPCLSAAETSPAEVFAAPAADVVRQRLNDWLAQRDDVAPELRAKIDRLWEQSATDRAADRLELVVASFGLADADVQTLIDACQFPAPELIPPEASLLDREGLPGFYVENVRLYFGSYLAQRQLYEEALSALNKVDVSQTIDPAACLFYKAVCEHHLLQKKEGLLTLEQLLERTENVPDRYKTVAQLMKYDLEGLKDKSLDEISRKMRDVERRLDLGRSGQKVQKVEDEIIAGLDEIIKKIEQQQGGGGGGGEGEGGKSNSAESPANDSSVKGDIAPGEVDPKKFKKDGNWGGLDDKMRRRVKHLIGRDFPSHYRRAVEEYFRNTAKRTTPNGNN